MEDKQKNQFPIYVISRGRWKSRHTVKSLDWMGCDYKVIVERQEYDKYAEYIDFHKLLILPDRFIRNYDTCDNWPNQLEDPNYPCGAGAARNFAWEHSKDIGAKWHWVLDDNILFFYYYTNNRMFRIKSPLFFRMMEDFVLRYKNVAIAGPNYQKFIMMKHANKKPFVWNTRIYSCLLIRNDIPYRWRSRYNDDTDFSLRILKDGWCTIQFNAFLQDKITTMTVKGGLKDLYAKHGRWVASQKLKQMHPDVTEVKWKFNRWHHQVDYSRFKQKPIRDTNFKIVDHSKDVKLIPVNPEKEFGGL